MSGPGEADLQSALRENQALRDSVSVPFSSVRAAVSEWELVTEDKAIIKVIKHGVDIPLVEIPQPLDLPPWSEAVCSQVLRRNNTLQGLRERGRQCTVGQGNWKVAS